MPKRKETRKRSRRGWRWKRWLFPIVAVVVLLAFAPQLLAWWYGGKLLKIALPEYPALIEADSVHLAWWSPLVVNELRLEDTEGRELARLPRLRTNLALWRLALMQTDVGTIQLERPQLQIVLDENGSNLQRTLEPLLRRDAESAKRLRLQIDQARLTVQRAQDEVSQELWSLLGNIEVVVDPNRKTECRVQGDALFADQSVAGVVIEAVGTTTKSGQDWELKLSNLPLEMASPWLGSTSLAGRASGNIHVGVSQQPPAGGAEAGTNTNQQSAPTVAVRCQPLRFADLRVDSAGQPSFRSQQLTVAGELVWGQDGWKAEHVQINSDSGTLTANGTWLRPPANQSWTTSTWMSRLAAEPWQVEAVVDLTSLAESLPMLVRLQPETRILQGQVKIKAHSTSDAGTNGVQALLSSSELVIERAGQRWTWDRPLHVTADARLPAQGWVLDNLHASSEFFELQGAGTRYQANWTGRGDLDILRDQLEQFLDLGQLELAGQMALSGGWQRKEDQMVLQNKLTLQDFACTWPGRLAWREPELAWESRVTGTMRDGQMEQLLSAETHLVAGNDRLDAQLTEAIEWPRPERVPFHAEVNGQGQTWLARMQWLADGIVEEIDGNLEGQLTGVWTADQWQLDTIKFQALPVADDRDVIIAVADRRCVEPGILLEGSGNFSPQARRVNLGRTVLQTATIAARANSLLVDLSSQPPRIEADLSVRADLERLTRTLQPVNQPETGRWAGHAKGKLVVNHQTPNSTFSWTGEVANLVYAEPPRPPAGPAAIPASVEQWQTLIDEPKLTATAAGQYDWQQDHLKLTSLEVAAQSVASVQLAGEIRRARQNPDLDLNGSIDYDLAQLMQRLPDDQQRFVQASGQESHAFQLRGAFPPDSDWSAGRHRADWHGQGSLGWQSLNAWGVPIGPAKLAAKLEGGVLAFDPLTVDVAEGRILLAPRLDLTAHPARLQIPAGPMMDHVQLTPEMCQTWMRLIAPLLAEATRASGTFSLTVEDSSFPWGQWHAGQAKGSIQVHGARVGPGPLAQLVIGTVSQISTLVARQPLGIRSDQVALVLPEQTMQFRLADGLVHHDALTVQVGNVNVRTRGSVSATPPNRIELIVEVPVQERWIERTPALSAWRGKSIQFPISGTLTDPDLDREFLKSLGNQLLQGSAEQLLQQGLRRLFDRER